MDKFACKYVNLSSDFFTQIGFKLNTQYGNSEHSASFFVGNIVLMLFNKVGFKSFTRNELTDTKTSTEVLFSIGAASKEDVNELQKRRPQLVEHSSVNLQKVRVGRMVAHFLLRMDIVEIRYTWT